MAELLIASELSVKEGTSWYSSQALKSPADMQDT